MMTHCLNSIVITDQEVSSDLYDDYREYYTLHNTKNRFGMRIHISIKT